MQVKIVVCFSAAHAIGSFLSYKVVAGEIPDPLV